MDLSYKFVLIYSDLDETPPCAIEDEIFDPIIKTPASAGQPTCLKTACRELKTAE